MKRYIAIGGLWAVILAGCYFGLTSLARSDGWVITHSPHTTTIMRSDGQGLGRVIRVPQPRTDAEVAESDEADARWVAYCQPTLHWDASGGGGIWRYRYARPGCEFGRDHD